MRRVLQNDLISSFINTSYIVQAKDDEIVLKIGENQPNASELLMKKPVDEWAFITAYNPYSQIAADAENEIRHNHLLGLLSLHGYETLPAVGRSEDGKWEEPSVFILAISNEMAKSFGACFQQDAIVCGRLNYPVELVFCDNDR